MIHIINTPTEHAKHEVQSVVESPSSGAIAYPLARDLQRQFSPACLRLAIAGSIRRGKPDPGDIEIVAIPVLGQYTITDMFDFVVNTVTVNRLDEALSDLYQQGQWMLAVNAETQKPLKNGPRQKKLEHVQTGVLLDLFITEARKWAYTFTIRTGPAEFSHALVTRALNLNMFFDECLLHNHPPVIEKANGKIEVRPCPSGEACPQIVEMSDEPDLFAALRVDYLSPAERAGIDPRAILRG